MSLSKRATGALTSSAFAILAQRVVWAEDEGIYGCDPSNCDEGKNLIAIAGITHMVADSDGVLIVSAGTLKHVPLPFTSGIRDLASVGSPSALTVDATHAFVAVPGVGVRIIEKSSGNAVTKYASRSPTDIAESGSSLYWIEGDKLIRAAK